MAETKIGGKMKTETKNIDFRTPLRKQRKIWKITNLFLRKFFKFDSWGLEKLDTLPKDKGVIFALPHIGWFDIFFMPAILAYESLRLPIFFLTRTAKRYKNKIFKWLLDGKYAESWGAHSSPLVLHHNNESYKKALKAHIKILENRGSLVIYPKGGIVPKKNQPLRIMPGIAFLLLHTGCPVVRVKIAVHKKRIGLLPWFPEICLIFENIFYKEDFEDILEKADISPQEKLQSIAEKIME